MYEKILVAVDHSEVTGRVLDAARELASLSQGEVWVLHLRERETMGRTGLLMSPESRDEAGGCVTGPARPRLPHHGDVRLGFQHFTDPRPDDLVIVQQEHADLPAPARRFVHALARSCSHPPGCGQLIAACARSDLHRSHAQTGKAGT